MSAQNRNVSSAPRMSDEVIAICAVNATLKTDGVAGMAGGIPNALSKNILGKELVSKGIKVNQAGDGVEIDVSINVKYNTKIPAVAWDIQENVKQEVQTMTEMKVNAVNIHVQGVELADISEQNGNQNEEMTRENDDEE